jgi:hypothetical protein
MRYVNGIVVVCVLFFFIPIAALAGNLNDPGAPTSATSAMYTLEDIYNRLDVGTAGTKRTGAFTEPSDGPAGTGHTTDEIMGKAPSVDDTNGAGVANVGTGKTFWGLKSGEWGLRTGAGACSANSAPVEKTGQILCYNDAGSEIGCANTGQDGDELKGVDWPGPRFTADTLTVTDNLTGLTWSKDASPEAGGSGVEQVTWTAALTYCYDLSLGGSSDWRLPNIKELSSLIDFAYSGPALSNAAGTGKWTSGDVFTGVPLSGSNYWSSTTNENPSYTNYAWMVDLSNGVVHASVAKSGTGYVWPVRGGQ